MLLYEIKGLDKKTKEATLFYVIANSPEDALANIQFIVDPVLTGKIEQLGNDWK